MCACMTLSSISMPVYGADNVEQTDSVEGEQTVSEEVVAIPETDQDTAVENPEEIAEKSTENVEEEIGQSQENLSEESDEEEVNVQEDESQTSTEEVVASGTCGENAKWTYYKDETLIISGSGPMDSYTYDWDNYTSTAPWMGYRSKIKKIVVEDGITSIGAYAFKECGYGLAGKSTPLEEIIIGNDVEVIEREAFYACNPITVEKIQTVSLGSGIKKIEEDAFQTIGRIKNVKIPSLKTWMQIDFNGVGANPMCGGALPREREEAELYVDGKKLTDVVIPEGTTEIKDYTFWNCRLHSVSWQNQESVTAIGDGSFGYNDFSQIDIPQNVTSIGKSAFASCINLKSIELSDQVKKLGGAFWYCSSLNKVRLPQNLTEIDASMFLGCSALESIQIPDQVTSIGESAFEDCTSLKSIEIPGQVVSVGAAAFNGCTSIVSLEIPDSVETIGASAFLKAENLQTIKLPNALKVIKTNTFSNCSSLQSIDVPDTVEQIGSRAFENCFSLSSVTGGKSITTIGEGAFYKCEELSSIVIPENVKVINDSVFSECANLKQIELPSGIQEIGSNAFLNCTLLQKIILPDGMTSLGNSAFSGCTNLNEVQMANGITTISKNCFKDCSSLDKITIPETVVSIAAYAFSECTELKEITFLGDAPTIDEKAFFQVVATCYYPEKNETYTAEITTEDFGGDLKWTYEGETSEAKKCGDNITWSLSEDGVLTLSGSGEMYDYSKNDLNYAPWYEDRSNVKTLKISDGITHIGAYAFYQCGLTDIDNLPDSITSIGKYAFYFCRSLTSVENLPDSITSIGEHAFSECEIKNIKLPKNMEAISDGLFEQCKYLQTVEFPEKLRTIGENAFYTCLGLHSIEIPEGVVSIGDNCFTGCGNSSTYGAYYACSSFRNVKLPSTLKSLGEAFRWCTSLEKINIPNGITELKAETFAYCYNLSEVTFEWGVPQFSEKTFAIRRNTTITCYYPGNNPAWTKDKLQNYGAYAIKWVAKEMIKPSEGTGSGGSGSGGTGTGTGDNTSGSDSGTGSGSGSGGSGTGSSTGGSSTGGSSTGGSSTGGSSTGGTETGGSSAGGSETGGDGSESTDANKCGMNIVWTLSEDGVLKLSGSGSMYDYSKTDSDYAPWYEKRTEVKSLEISEGITHIGDYAFYGCSLKAADNLPDSITTIGKYAFGSCASLQSIANLPEGITEIGEGAFSACCITEIKLPDGLENITKDMLYNCKYLKQVKFPTKLKTIGDDAFLMCLGLNSVEIPEGVVSIGDGAFAQCGNSASWGMYYPSSSFTSVKLPSTLQELGSSVFYGCASLKTINIPGKVKVLKDGIFMRCTKLSTITFDWGVPQFGSKVLDTTTKVTLTCYYPANNPEWTADKLQKYGAYAVNWIAQEMPEPSEGNESTMGYTAHSLTLNGDIGVNFYVELNDTIVNDVDAVMEMAVNSQKVSSVKVTDVIKNGVTEVTDSKGIVHSCYKFTCKVYAKQMNDEIEATLKATSGTWKETYSIQKYVEQAQESSNENLKELVNAMSNYGIWAQKLLEYNTDNLTEDSLPDVSQVTADQLTAYTYVENGSEDNLKVYGSSLLLKEKTSIRMYYSLKSGTIQDYTFKIDGNEVVPVKSGNNGLYYVEIDNIAAQDLDKVHTFTVGKLEISNYSVLSYIGKALKSEKSSENNKNTAAALYLYWNAAEKYFEK